MTLLDKGGVTGNSGMEWWLILASSRWRRWVRWWAPTGRRPTPGCRSTRRSLYPAPTPYSSPYRWWLRSSRTNLQGEGGGKKVSAGIWDHVSLQCCALCLAEEVSRSVFPRRRSLHVTSQAQRFMLIELQSSFRNPLSCFAHLHGPTWHDLFVRPPSPPPPHPSLPDISTCSAGSLPSVIIPVLAEWAPGCQAMGLA